MKWQLLLAMFESMKHKMWNFDALQIIPCYVDKW